MPTPITPELKRIMLTGYLDHMGFWNIVPQAEMRGGNILKFNRFQAIMYAVCPLGTLFLIAWISGVGWFSSKIPQNVQGPLHWLPIVMIAAAILGVALPIYIGRTWQVYRAWRAGPWITLNEFSKSIILPRHNNVEVLTSQILWSTLHSVHDFGRRKSSVTELQLLLFPDTPQRICISVTADYGKHGMQNIDHQAQLLSELTRAKWQRSGYPST